jgi:hypothetical protein
MPEEVASIDSFLESTRETTTPGRGMAPALMIPAIVQLDWVGDSPRWDRGRSGDCALGRAGLNAAAITHAAPAKYREAATRVETGFACTTSSRIDDGSKGGVR